MKKVWILLCMLVSLLCINKQAYASTQTPALTVSKVSAQAGSTVDVPITIANNTGICGATLSVTYDQNLTLTGVTSGDAFKDMAFTKPGELTANPVKLLWDNVNAVKTNGTIAVLTFTVPKKDGSYKISVSYDEGDVIDGDLNPVTMAITNGSIEVKSQTSITGTCGQNVTWSLSGDGVLTISGKGTMKNYTYKSEMPWYKYNSQIKSVVVEEGVTSIGDYAFYGMPAMTSISLPKGLTVIGGFAFKNSTALNNVVLPSTLTKLGESAFYGCSSLQRIEIPKGIYTVWAYTFKNCTNLKEVVLPSTLIKIDEAAFYGCSSLTSLDIPDSVSIIGIYSFKNCSKLSSVKLP